MGVSVAPGLWSLNMLTCVVQPVEKAYREALHKQGRHDEDQAQFISCYIDDVFITTKTVGDHLLLLDVLFAQMEKMHLTISINKCHIMKKSVPLLGSFVSSDGKKVQPKRIATLRAAAPPRSVRELRIWLGRLRYVAEWVPNLTNMLKSFDKLGGKVTAARAVSTPIYWTKELMGQFNHVQDALSDPRHLFHYTPERPLYLQTDASHIGYGAVVFQTDADDKEMKVKCPIAYYSHNWETDAQRHYDATMKELRPLRD